LPPDQLDRELARLSYVERERTVAALHGSDPLWLIVRRPSRDAALDGRHF